MNQRGCRTRLLFGMNRDEAAESARNRSLSAEITFLTNKTHSELVTSKIKSISKCQQCGGVSTNRPIYSTFIQSY